MRKAVILSTSDPIYDQRLLKVRQSLLEMGYQVKWLGVNRNPEEESTIFRRIQITPPKGPKFYFNFGKEITKFLTAEKPQLIWSADPDTLWKAATYKRKNPSTFLVYDAHELFDQVPELTSKPLKRWIWKRLESNSSKLANLCLTVSKPIADILENRCKKSFHVLKNVPIKNQTEASAPTFDIIYQGMLNEGRGLEQLLLATQNSNIKVLIAGSGDIEQSLYHLKTSNHHFVGKQTPEALKKLTANAKWGYNLLDISKSKSYEYSLANKFFDYVQAGVPVITEDTETYRSLINQFEVGVAISLKNLNTEKLQEIISSNQYETYQANCKKAAEVWNWENEFESIKALLP